MTDAINLLYKKKNYRRYEQFFSLFRKLSVLLIVAIFLIAASLLAIIQNERTQYKKLLNTKERLVKRLISRKEMQTQLAFIVDKTSFYKSFANDQVAYDEYFNNLEKSLPQTPVPASILSLSLDKKKSFQAISYKFFLKLLISAKKLK